MRVFNAVFEKVTVSAAQDLFEVVAPADAVVVILGWKLGQSSDAGDAESEQLNVLLHRGSTSGSGGSTVTPSPNHVGDSAFGGTVEANNTSLSTEGAFLDAACFNVMAGIETIYTPENYKYVSPSGRIVLKLQDAPADPLTVNGVITFGVLGG